MNDRNIAQTSQSSSGPRPTDFLAFSREFARQVGLDPDISTWQSEEFQAFLDWWLLRTRGAFSEG
jgi:hypothetical protein